MPKYDLLGKTFGRLTVIEHCYKDNVSAWKCKCSCGNEKIIKTSYLIRGVSNSCGCYCRELHANLLKTHGMTNTRIYKIYKDIKRRCYNPNCSFYNRYGGRGITICDEWLNDFMNFYNWSMANGYEDNLTIDRINVNGNYEPSNCRWIDYKAQARNRRNNRLYTHNGETKCISEWAEITGIPYSTLSSRIKRELADDEIFKSEGINNGKKK